MQELLHSVAHRAERYLNAAKERRVSPSPEAVRALDAFREPLPAMSSAPEDVLEMLDRIGSPATTTTAGPRFFGFVIGGSLPAALGANWLASAWDQNAGLFHASPTAAVLEEVSLEWLTQLLGLPAGCGAGFVTGATVANFTTLAAARHAVLARAGWDVESDGLFGAPAIHVVLSEESHPSVFKALGMLGLGRNRVIRIPVDSQGRMIAERIPRMEGPAIFCVQAGNVNTGSFDPAREMIRRAREIGAWVHVDGAFGLWAAASRALAHLADGLADADSWATDAHKWLNVPYDSGLAFVRNPADLRGAMSLSAAYLPQGEHREPLLYVPELSRRARGIDIWAALKSLGRAGVSDMVERCCQHASRFAQGLSEAGCEILNEVVLNQVLVSFGTPERTHEVIAAIQEEGTCWCGPTLWQGRTAMRISVCSAATTEQDVEESLEAIVRIARAKEMEPLTGIEPVTSSLPRTRSTI